ncbi:PhzF family phenazine biosynthesis protein [Spongiimicrobium salis]|uniref:PhzF family phenazine biosynthesis protein n=1 Tax=Spongiimicrobium salis TaxID=1667022 RepID=UPI00374D2E3F
MMSEKLQLFQIDTFTDTIFGGNPAAVLLLKEWLSAEKMQKIANENNLAETVFIVQKEKALFEIRWFTPTVEVDLCGHATLAAAYVLFTYHGFSLDRVNFHSHASGVLSVTKKEDALTLDFPVDSYTSVNPPQELLEAFDAVPIETYKGKTDYLLIFSSQKEVEMAKPNLNLIKSCDSRGVIITAQGEEVDFVSRFFAPQSGIDEDPVTGSAHTTLTPIWSKKLGKLTLSAQQLSARKGELTCTLKGNRVQITGKAVTYMIGELLL